MNLSAVLLAGGESRRMGQDKATLRLDGKPLWQIQLELLRKLNPHEILISAREDPAWRPDDVVFVPDKQPSRGPLSGLAASLGKIETTHLLVLAIDMPFMTEEHLLSLSAGIAPGVGVVPMIDHRAEPLAAIYPFKAAAGAEAMLLGPDVSMRSFANRLVRDGRLRGVEVSDQERNFYRNLNERSDIEAR